jgi:hypothetical protein
MATKQMIVTICLMAGVLLAEARNVIHEAKAANPDVDLTTVSFFLLR